MTGIAGAQDAPACTLEMLGSAAVIAVRDGRTFIRDDGTEARLAGIETPAAGEAGAEDARLALDALIRGRTLTLKHSAPAEDRYGRALVYAFVADGGVEHSVQATLLARGLARVSARAGSRACAAALLAREAVAREAGHGLWTGGFAPRDAHNGPEITAKRGHFAVVEGTVVSVRESRGVVYMNFGRRYTRDFTVTILKRNERIFTAAGIEPRKLEGRRVRVRGWIEQRRGPVIEATRPEQLELAGLN